MAFQTPFLLRILLLLKGYRLLFMVPIVLTLIFGIQISQLVSERLISHYLDKPLSHSVTPNFISNSKLEFLILQTHTERYVPWAMEILQSDVTENLTGYFKICITKAECFNSIYTCMFKHAFEAHNTSYYLDFNNQRAICQGSYKTILSCLFASVLIGQTWIKDKRQSYVVKTFEFFQLGSTPHPNSKSTEACNTVGYFSKLPLLLIVNVALASVIICTYLLISTVSCVNQLKGRGFLQLMMRKGLSPFAYWSSVWLVTIIELLIFTASFGLSFYLHCPIFYSVKQVIYSSLIIGTHLFCMSAIVLLFTVLSNNYCTICKCAYLYLALSLALMLTNREAAKYELQTNFWRFLKIALLMLPCGNISELLYHNLSGGINPAELNNNFYIAGLLVTCLVLGIVVIVTLYLDHVLKTGNGFCYPGCYPFRHISGDDSLPVSERPIRMDELQEKHSIFARVSGCSADVDYKGVGISVNFYDEQIAVVYSGEGSARRNSFIDFVTGRARASRGSVWVDGCVASDPMARLYTHTRLGECLENNALCHSLTVLDTLKTALVSSDCSWSDCETEINTMLSLLRLTDMLLLTVECLSKGQRRKLCIAMALIGNPRLVVLHNPTRGLDPLSRLRLWRLLQDYRRGRCIIISTQFIDEADMFADKKVFLSHCGNNFICAGSSNFIRRSVGCDYVVEATLRDASQCELLKPMLSSTLPTEALIQYSGSKITVSLTKQDANLIPKVINALRPFGDDFDSVGVNHIPLSLAYKRLCKPDNEQINIVHAQQDQTQVNKAVVNRKNGESQRADNKAMNPNETVTQTDPEVLNRTSSRSGGCAISGFFWLYFLLVQRRSRVLTGRIVFYIFIITLHLLMVIMERSSFMHGSGVWLSSSKEVQFSRGICVAHEEVSLEHRVTAVQCGRAYTGDLTTGDNFKVMLIRDNQSVASFLAAPRQRELIEQYCPATENLPCPVTLSNSWSVRDTSVNRSIIVGAYNSHFQADPVASAAIVSSAARALQRYFMTGNEPRVNFTFGMYIDYRDLSVAQYAAFSQIFILLTLPALYLEDIVNYQMGVLKRYIQTVGVNSFCFWTGIFLSHWLPCALLSLLTVAMNAAIHPQVYAGLNQLVVAAVMISSGLTSNILLAYVLSSGFYRSGRTLPGIYLCLCIITSMLPAVTQKIDIINRVLIFIWPPFALAAIVFYSAKFNYYVAGYNSDATEMGVVPIVNGLFPDQLHTTACLVAFPAQIIGLIVILFFFTYCCGRFQCGNCLSRNNDAENQYTDHDELAIDDLESNQNANSSLNMAGGVELRKLTKVYPPDIQAIRRLDFVIESGKVFEVVGPNGSGLSTLVRTILGEEIPTSGKCLVISEGNSPTSAQNAKSNRMFAYAPEWSPIFNAVTPKEHLELYSLILKAGSAKLQDLLEVTGLSQCKDEPVRNLSEGYRRRLSVAIALLTTAPVLLIDDMSNGITAEEEAKLWSSLENWFKRYMSVIVTAHSLTGADRLNCQVAIINNGLLGFAGSMHEFKQKHRCHVLELEFPSEVVELAHAKKADLLKAIFNRFYSSDILDQSLTWIKISIPKQDFGSDVDNIRWLLGLKDQYKLEDMLYYPASLDQLFEMQVKAHEAKVQKRIEAEANPNAPPLVPFYEKYYF